MKVNFNTQEYNNNTNFKALKYMSGIKKFGYKDGGFDVEKYMHDALTKSMAFNELCKKYDVYVNIGPTLQFKDNFFKKGLSIEIFAEKIKTGFFGLFVNKTKKPVGKYAVTGNNLTPEKMAEFIKTYYINDVKGLLKDIDKFMSKRK